MADETVNSTPAGERGPGADHEREWVRCTEPGDHDRVRWIDDERAPRPSAPGSAGRVPRTNGEADAHG